MMSQSKMDIAFVKEVGSKIFKILHSWSTRSRQSHKSNFDKGRYTLNQHAQMNITYSLQVLSILQGLRKTPKPSIHKALQV